MDSNQEYTGRLKRSLAVETESADREALLPGVE